MKNDQNTRRLTQRWNPGRWATITYAIIVAAYCLLHTYLLHSVFSLFYVVTRMNTGTTQCPGCGEAGIRTWPPFCWEKIPCRVINLGNHTASPRILLPDPPPAFLLRYLWSRIEKRFQQNVWLGDEKNTLLRPDVVGLNPKHWA